MKSNILSLVSKLFAFICFVGSFFVLQACRDLEGFVPSEFREESYMFQEKEPLDSLSLGEIYSRLLPSRYPWKLKYTYRQEAYHQHRDGEEILDRKGLHGIYTFWENGQGNYLDSSRVVQFSWKFSDDGAEFKLVEEGDVEMTYKVVDIGWNSLIVDGMQSTGDLIRLVYTLETPQLGANGVNLSRENLFCKTLEAQIRAYRDHIENLEYQLVAGSQPTKELDEKIIWIKRKMQYKGKTLGMVRKIISENIEFGRGKTREELLTSVTQKTYPKTCTEEDATLSPLMAFLSGVVWDGPPRYFHLHGRNNKIPMLYTFDPQGVVWRAMKNGHGSGRYQPMCSTESDKRWRVYSVSPEKASFELTDAPLGRCPGREHRLIKARTNFIGYSVKDSKTSIIFNKMDKGYKFRIDGKRQELGGWYVEHL